MARFLLYPVFSLFIFQSSYSQNAGLKAVGFYNSGLAFEKEAKYEEALASFKKAVAESPTYKEALFEAGWCNSELGNYQDALFYLKKAKDQWPKEAKIYYETGYAYQQLNKLSEAKANYYKCLLFDKEYSLAYKALGNLLFNEGEYKTALENLTAYGRYETDIDSWDYYYKKGFAENEMEKFNDAIISLNSSLRLKNDEPGCYNELGWAYYNLNDADKAIINYNKSIGINNNSYTAYIGLGDIYRELKKDNAEALKNYSKATELAPENKKAQYYTGWCYNEKNQYNDAIPYLKKAISIDKNYINALIELGYSYYALEQHSDALAQFDKAISLDKVQELPYYYSGLCYVAMKDKTDAMKMYDFLDKAKSKYAEKLRKKIDEM